MNTDRWYYRVFQGAPDLIRALLPGAAGATNTLSLDPAAPGDSLYRFEALEIKELSHRLDGVLWPRESTGCSESGSQALQLPEGSPLPPGRSIHRQQTSFSVQVQTSRGMRLQECLDDQRLAEVTDPCSYAVSQAPARLPVSV